MTEYLSPDARNLPTDIAGWGAYQRFVSEALSPIPINRDPSSTSGGAAASARSEVPFFAAEDIWHTSPQFVNWPPPDGEDLHVRVAVRQVPPPLNDHKSEQIRAVTGTSGLINPIPLLAPSTISAGTPFPFGWGVPTAPLPITAGDLLLLVASWEDVVAGGPPPPTANFSSITGGWTVNETVNYPGTTPPSHVLFATQRAAGAVANGASLGQINLTNFCRRYSTMVVNLGDGVVVTRTVADLSGTTDWSLPSIPLSERDGLFGLYGMHNAAFPVADGPEHASYRVNGGAGAITGLVHFSPFADHPGAVIPATVTGATPPVSARRHLLRVQWPTKSLPRTWPQFNRPQPGLIVEARLQLVHSSTALGNPMEDFTINGPWTPIDQSPFTAIDHVFDVGPTFTWQAFARLQVQVRVRFPSDDPDDDSIHRDTDARLRTWTADALVETAGVIPPTTGVKMYVGAVGMG